MRRDWMRSPYKGQESGVYLIWWATIQSSASSTSQLNDVSHPCKQMTNSLILSTLLDTDTEEIRKAFFYFLGDGF